MDPSVYVVMSAAKQEMQTQHLHSENMANSEVIGYKASRSSVQPLYLSGGRINPRAYFEVNSHRPDLADGPLDYTGRQLDIAFRGNRWLPVLHPSGEIGFVHSASLTLDPQYRLVTEMGYPVADLAGQALTYEGASAMNIMPNGEIFSKNPMGEIDYLGRLPVYALVYEDIVRGETGMISITDNQSATPVGDKAGLVVGALEQSNASSAKILVDLMNTKENYSADMATFRAFKDMSSKTTDTLLR